MKIAILSNGVNVDLHLGKGESAYIYLSENDFELIDYKFISINKEEKHQSAKVINALNDCDVIIAQDFGFKAKIKAEENNIILYRADGPINEAYKDFMN